MRKSKGALFNAVEVIEQGFIVDKYHINGFSFSLDELTDNDEPPPYTLTHQFNHGFFDDYAPKVAGFVFVTPEYDLRCQKQLNPIKGMSDVPNNA